MASYRPARLLHLRSEVLPKPSYTGAYVRLPSTLTSCFWQIKLKIYAHAIAAKIYPMLRQASQKKFGRSLPRSQRDVPYLTTRAVQLAQPLVDELMLANPRIPTTVGNKLILDAARKSVAMVGAKQRPRRAA